MIRRSLALLVLVGPLLACSAPAEDEPVGPAETPGRSAPMKPARERAPAGPQRGKATLRAGGGYYQYVDESGRVRIAASLDEVPIRQRSTAGRISAPGAAPSGTARVAPRVSESAASVARAKTTSAEVVLYTTRSCGYCRQARAYFDRIGQDYVDKDVERDSDARDEFLELTHGSSGVPVILIGDQMLQGWSQPRVEQMIAANP